MARGFVGGASSGYFANVESVASRNASAVGMAKGGTGASGIEDASSQYPTGVGNSSNVAVDEGVYDAVVRQMERTDEEMAERIHQVSERIRQLCETDFVLPDAVPRIEATIGAVDRSLGNFQEITERAAGVLRRYVSRIAAADHR